MDYNSEGAPAGATIPDGPTARGFDGGTGPQRYGGEHAPYLYDMQADPSETTNLYEARPGVASRLLRELELYVHGGRGTPGLTSDNDFAPINLWKSGRNY